MMIEVLKSKLHCVTVTEANLHYMGSGFAVRPYPIGWPIQISVAGYTCLDELHERSCCTSRLDELHESDKVEVCLVTCISALSWRKRS